MTPYLNLFLTCPLCGANLYVYTTPGEYPIHCHFIPDLNYGRLVPDDAEPISPSKQCAACPHTPASALTTPRVYRLVELK